MTFGTGNLGINGIDQSSHIRIKNIFQNMAGRARSVLHAQLNNRVSEDVWVSFHNLRSSFIVFI